MNRLDNNHHCGEVKKLYNNSNIISSSLASDDDGKCDDSYVEVREGQGELSPLIGQYCGDVKPGAILTDGGILWVRFKSGRKRHRMASGFAARYQSVCK